MSSDCRNRALAVAGGETAPVEALHQEILELPRVSLAHRLSAAELAAQVGRDLLRRRRGLDREQVERRRSARVARLREMVRLHDERAHVARLLRQRPFDRRERAGVVLEQPAGVGECEAAGRVGLTGADDTLERVARGPRVAPAQRLHAGCGQ